MESVKIFVLLSVLLAVGKWLRLRLPLLQKLYLPSSVVGGAVGLVIFSLFPSVIEQETFTGISKLPGFLINIIFATLFIGTAVPNVKKVVAGAFRQLCLGQIIAWGQYVLGIGLSAFFLSKKFGVPSAFGNLLEIGFEGGHGTVGGMSSSFEEFGWHEGIQLGYVVATIGMITGIVVGMTLIQWAYRKGHVKKIRPYEERRLNERIGIYLRSRRPSAGSQTVCSDSIDSLAWHLAIVGVAMLIGWGLWSLIPMKGFPLFPLCMAGGVLLQLGAKMIKHDLLVDRMQMSRISGAALDFLVVAAVATIRIDVVAANWLPIVILCLCGVLWTVFAVMVLAPRIFRDAWFERAIAEFGQATGVTATGLMLLRSVDPGNKTSAATGFGYKQLLHEPIMGGGVWTAMAFSLVYTIGWQKVLLISLAAFVFWIIIALILILKKR